MPLFFANIGQEVQIAALRGNPQARQHLAELGFNVGSLVAVVQKADSGVIVKVKDARVALDSAMASKIIVANDDRRGDRPDRTAGLGLGLKSKEENDRNDYIA